MSLFSYFLAKLTGKTSEEPVVEVEVKDEPQATASSKVVSIQDPVTLKNMVSRAGVAVLLGNDPGLATSVVRRGPAAGMATLRRVDFLVSLAGQPARKVTIQEPNTWIYPRQAGFAPVWWGDQLLCFVHKSGAVVTRSDDAAWDVLMERASQ
jgi:hypothetical protein